MIHCRSRIGDFEVIVFNDQDLPGPHIPHPPHFSKQRTDPTWVPSPATPPDTDDKAADDSAEWVIGQLLCTANLEQLGQHGTRFPRFTPHLERKADEFKRVITKCVSSCRVLNMLLE